jgi:hypothetical protein
LKRSSRVTTVRAAATTRAATFFQSELHEQQLHYKQSHGLHKQPLSSWNAPHVQHLYELAARAAVVRVVNDLHEQQPFFLFQRPSRADSAERTAAARLAAKTSSSLASDQLAARAVVVRAVNEPNEQQPHGYFPQRELSLLGDR